MPRGGPIADAVAEAIRMVRDAHRLTPDTSPTSTVAIARWSDGVVETYALGDSYVVVLRADGTESVYTDNRLDAVGAPERAAYRTRLAAGHGYDVGHRELLLALQAEQAQHRNQPGGYWIAGAEPEAGHHGIATTDRRSGITGVLLRQRRRRPGTLSTSCGLARSRNRRAQARRSTGASGHPRCRSRRPGRASLAAIEASRRQDAGDRQFSDEQPQPAAAGRLSHRSASGSRTPVWLGLCPPSPSTSRKS